MTITINKKEVVTKASIVLNFETAEDIKAFKKILSCANAELFRQYTGTKTTEKTMMETIQNIIEKNL